MKRFRIGRAETNEIVLYDRSVSREHAEIMRADRETFLLRDLGSTYGTSVRFGRDWHLIATENVTYTTQIRIGAFETTVAALLEELDPLAVYTDPARDRPWTPTEPCLSPEEPTQQPAPIQAGGWDPSGEPPPPFVLPPRRDPPPLFVPPPPPRRAGARLPLVLLSLIGLGAVLAAAFFGAASGLG